MAWGRGEERGGGRGSCTWFRDFIVNDMPNLVGMRAIPRFFHLLLALKLRTCSCLFIYSLLSINYSNVSDSKEEGKEGGRKENKLVSIEYPSCYL